MSDPKPTHAVVRSTLGKSRNVSTGLTTMGTVCTAAAQCPQVQASPVAMAALGALQTSSTTAGGSNTAHSKAKQVALATGKTLASDYRVARTALGTFEGVVNGIAAGDATIIAKAGLLSRDDSAPAPPLAQVVKVTSTPGKKLGTAKLSWPAASGATSYAVELNPTPQSPAGPWVSAGNATPRRSRVVTAPAPGAQVLARVAAVAGDGTTSDWSDVILATAR